MSVGQKSLLWHDLFMCSLKIHNFLVKGHFQHSQYIRIQSTRHMSMPNMLSPCMYFQRSTLTHSLTMHIPYIYIPMLLEQTHTRNQQFVTVTIWCESHVNYSDKSQKFQFVDARSPKQNRKLKGYVQRTLKDQDNVYV